MGDLFAPVLKLKQKLPKLADAEGKPGAIAAGLEIAAEAQGCGSKKNAASNRGPARRPARRSRRV
jgi:hypothetical protein